MVIAFLKMNPFHHKLRPKNEVLLDILRGGEYNGYVAFDNELPDSWQRSASLDDDNVLDNMVEVHGGITLDCPMKEMLDDPIIPLTAMPAPEELKRCRCIGFDTLHCDDTIERWPLEAVKEETLNLMKQIEKLIAEQKEEKQ